MKVTKSMGVILPDTTITKMDPVFLDTEKAPFRLYGFCENFRRVPKDVAAATSEAVATLAEYSTGGRVRFRTDSDYIVVHADTSRADPMASWSIAATIGFDVYFCENGKQHFKGTFFPSQDTGKTFIESRLCFEEKGMKDVIINFPLFAAIDKFYVALREGSELDYGSEYKYEKPFVVYGSSIVNGVGAGRPGTEYPAEISRRLDCDFVNLGFSGAAKAEQAMIEYISGLDMCVFVYDYDHNAPSPEYLEATHYKGYKYFREKNPGVPVIMVSKPDYHFNNHVDNERRRQTIIADYNRARAEGDELVWFVDGSLIYPEDLRDVCTVDGCHPNDVGYLYMAKKIGAAVKEALDKIS